MISPTCAGRSADLRAARTCSRAPRNNGRSSVSSTTARAASNRLNSAHSSRRARASSEPATPKQQSRFSVSSQHGPVPRPNCRSRWSNSWKTSCSTAVRGDHGSRFAFGRHGPTSNSSSRTIWRRSRKSSRTCFAATTILPDILSKQLQREKSCARAWGRGRPARRLPPPMPAGQWSAPSNSTRVPS